MNNTGRDGEKNGYRVILLLVVGLTAFSSAMKELNQLQQFTLDVSRMIAQSSQNFAPAELPQVTHVPEIKETVVKVESCELKQSLPSVELPWLSTVAPASIPKPRAVVPRPSQAIDLKKDVPKPSEFHLAKLKKFTQMDIPPLPFDVTVVTDAGPERIVFAEQPASHTKTRTRTRRDIRIHPRDREIILKTLNRSINLRFAS